MVAKLGLLPGMKIKLINEPQEYKDYLTGLNGNICFVNKLTNPVDIIHLFVKSKKELLIELPFFKNYLDNNGYLIISWPSQQSNTFTDLSNSFIFNLGSSHKLQQVDFFELDGQWSASKFKRI